MDKCGARISRLRKQAGYTQAGLAERLGISYQAVSSWERGASMPDIGKLLDLAGALQTSVDYLLSGEDANTAEGYTAVSALKARTDMAAETSMYESDPEQEQFSKPDQEPGSASGQESKKRNLSFSTLLKLAPFMDQETIDAAVPRRGAAFGKGGRADRAGRKGA